MGLGLIIGNRYKGCLKVETLGDHLWIKIAIIVPKLRVDVDIGNLHKL